MTAPTATSTRPTPTGPGLPGFLDRVGDPVGLLDDTGHAHLGEDLFAAAVTELVADAERTGPVDAVVVTHPAAWNSYTTSALAAALDRTGRAHVHLVPDALAAAAWLDAAHGPRGDDVVVVYDLGASGLTVTVVRTGDDPVILGRPLHSDEFGGDRIDHLVTRHVLESVADKLDDLDTSDPATVTALTELRRRCRDAKQTLSADTEAVVPVALPGLGTDVRLVRAELEDLIREPLSRSLALTREAVRGTDVDFSDVGCILLVGGGASIPLVAELVSADLGRPVVTAPEPALTAALGAAQLARARAVSAGAPTVTMPAADASGTDEHPVPETVVAGFPGRRGGRRRGWSTRRRLAVVTSAAAAVTVLAAGGLALGTASNTVTPPGMSPAGSTSAAETVGADSGTDSGAGAPSGIGAATITVGSDGVARPTVVDAATGRLVPAGAPAGRGTAAAPADGTAPNTPTEAPATPEAPAAPGIPPAPEAPAVQPVPQPVYTPPAPDPGQIGTGVGNAATGIGRGLGGVVTGVGNGVGGVVDGLGGVVGAVVDPVTGLLVGP
ncbi:Hsp70 family protein [Prescottella sp. R16]|uniref:Hsp70 family protein n=1 Tax=Prescottella sp. R16 TaxID=3064529 RepID=UPI00272EA463|nr:Hsp70 family protein [Prescottella sp. R16]